MKSGQRSSQRGAVLIVGLIMVLLMTTIGLAAIRGSGMQEMMAGNMRDRNLAFQAAEAALRVAERDLAARATMPAFDGSVTGFLDAEEPINRAAAWSEFAWSNQSLSSSLEIEGVSQVPRYVVEEITATRVAGTDGSAVDFESLMTYEEAVHYRITARGVGANPSTEVILQTMFKR